MKTIQLAKSKSKYEKQPEYEGPIDVLIVSPVQGEPWYIYFVKSQLSKNGAFQDFKTFMKGYRHESDVRWSFTFDKKDRWHSVRRPPAPQSGRAPQSLYSDRLCLARQITNDGTPNALTLGAFLADDETKAVIRDRSIVKTLSFKASLLGPLIPKVEAVANSDKWIFEAFSDGDDDDPPEAPAVFPPCIADEDVGGPSTSREAIRPKEPPPTVVGAKRKSSRA